jgi:hypothetical protein
MTLNDFLDIALWAFFVSLGINLVLKLMTAKLELELEARQELLAKVSNIVHIVKEETVGEMVYWFDRDNDRFLAQGKTKEEIIAVLKERFSNHIFILEAEQKMMVGPEFELLPVTANLETTKIIQNL